MIPFLQVVGGLILLIIGGESLVRGAVVIAKRFKLPSFIIGLTIVAYGTSSPEMAISVLAALGDHSDIALGNVVGSNISNILLVLGLSSVIYPITIQKKVASRDSIVMGVVTLVLAALAMTLDSLSLFSACIFLGMFIFHNSYIVYCHKKGIHTLEEELEEEVQTTTSMPLSVAILACLLGTGLLAFGGNVLVGGAVSLAKSLGVPESAVGVTIVALGGSLPELTASVIAALHKKSGIALGNVVGSNIVNILGVLGVTSLIGDVKVAESFITFDIPIMILATAALVGAIFFLKKLYRPIGVMFCLAYAGYVTILFS